MTKVVKNCNESSKLQYALITLCCVLSCSVMSDSWHPHGLWLARLLCPLGCFRQEHWSGLPCPPPGDLPNPVIELKSPALQADSLPSEPPGKPIDYFTYIISKSVNTISISIYLSTFPLHIYVSYNNSIRQFIRDSDKSQASLVAQMVKNLPAMRETWVQSLGWEDPLEEGVATHSSILVWRSPHGKRRLAGYSAWGCKELDVTERLSTAHTNASQPAYTELDLTGFQSLSNT